MKVWDAKQAAKRWVDEVASGLPGFQGAFFHGSVNGMADADPFPASSDVDVGVVFSASDPMPSLGKVRREGVVVEGASISFDRIGSTERLLADCRLGHSFRTDSVISDPTGHLVRVQQGVERRFAQRRWIRARCEDARSGCLRYAHGLDGSTPEHLQAIFWLFAEGGMAHVLLAAGMRNLSVRRRYAAVRELLASSGRLDVYDVLMTMLGCATMKRSRIEHHLTRMTEAFDRAASLIRSEFPFGSDIGEAGRPLAIGGSRKLIEAGQPRDAVFWIAVTYARCMAVLDADGPRHVAKELEPGFREIMSDLGVETFEDMLRRTAEIEAYLPELMAIADELLSANPDVED